MEELKLEVGKTYKNEAGEIIEINYFVNSGSWIFYFGEDKSIAYRKNGTALEEGQLDLVKEVTV